MTPEPTSEKLAFGQAEPTEHELSRFESEGGSTIIEQFDGSREPVLLVRGSDHRGRILIVYAARQHHTHVIADAVAQRLRNHGFAVEVGDASAGTMPPPQDYDVVVLGSPMLFGPQTRRIGRYVEDNRTALVGVRSALFTVSDSGTLRDHAPGGFLEQFLRTLDWQPDVAAAFAGGEPFPRDGMLLRFVTWVGAARAHGTTTRRTDWTDVHQFADTIATELAGAAATAERTEPHVMVHVQ